MSIKVGSAFSGIGAWEKAFDRLGMKYELKWFFEKDKYALTAYCAIHDVNENLNKGDITEINVDDLEDIDVFVYSPPCQAFSVAGKRLGIKDPRGTLFYYALPIIESKKPKYALMENVKGLTTKGMKDLFKDMLEELENLGYNNYWQVLNSKDYGIPQNRERVYVVSIRKDIDDGSFTFPTPFDGGLRLKDLLEDEVEKKYYINNNKTRKLLSQLNYKQSNKLGVDLTINEPKFKDYVNCIKARYDAGVSNQKSDGTGVAEPIIVASRGRNPENPSDRTVGSPTEQRLEPNSQGVCNTLTSVQKDNLVLEPTICEERRDEGLRFFKDNVCGTLRTIDAGGDKRVIEKSPNELQLFTNLSGGKWDKIHESARRVYKEDGIVPTIPTCGRGNIEPKVQSQYRIRKLTPLECWRLMDFDDEDYWKARRALEETYYNGKDRSNSQMYKMAGNSITVGVLEEIFKNLFI